MELSVKKVWQAPASQSDTVQEGQRFSVCPGEAAYQQEAKWPQWTNYAYFLGKKKAKTTEKIVLSPTADLRERRPVRLKHVELGEIEEKGASDAFLSFVFYFVIETIKS
jgi:hypothetical protein